MQYLGIWRIMDICLTTEEFFQYLKIWRILAEKILVVKPKSISEAIWTDMKCGRKALVTLIVFRPFV